MFNHVPIEVGKLVQVNAKGGRYYETPSGAKYPSVTSVTRLHNLESIQAWISKFSGLNKINELFGRNKFLFWF